MLQIHAQYRINFITNTKTSQSIFPFNISTKQTNTFNFKTERTHNLPSLNKDIQKYNTLIVRCQPLNNPLVPVFKSKQINPLIIIKL